MNPKVLAVVPVYKGEPTVVVRAIRSLLSQDYPYLRIIILDDDSKGDLFKTLQNALCSFSQITWIKNESNIGFANTLNKALSLVVDETFFLVLEQDCELSTENYLTAAIKHFDDPHVGVVCGENTPPPTEDLTIIKRVFVRHFCEDELDSGIVEAGFSLLKADVFRTYALQMIKGFESAASWKFACEEHMVSYKLKSLGYKIVKDSQLKFRTYSDGQENLRQNLKKEALYGRGLGWALARKQSNLDVGKSEQLKSKKIGRIIQTLHVTISVLSLFVFFLSPLIASAIMLSGTIVLVAYLVGRMSVLQNMKEKVLFLVTGFMRSWVYVPSFMFGFFYGLVLRFRKG